MIASAGWIPIDSDPSILPFQPQVDINPVRGSRRSAGPARVVRPGRQAQAIESAGGRIVGVEYRIGLHGSGAEIEERNNSYVGRVTIHWRAKFAADHNVVVRFVRNLGVGKRERSVGRVVNRNARLLPLV